MSTLLAHYNPTAQTVRVGVAGTTVPDGYIAIGSFVHPDPVYPGSLVIYHGVRDLLYKRSQANPANTAKYPNNIVNMGNIQILYITPAGDEVPAGSLLIDNLSVLVDGSEIIIT